MAAGCEAGRSSSSMLPVPPEPPAPPLPAPPDITALVTTLVVITDDTAEIQSAFKSTTKRLG